MRKHLESEGWWVCRAAGSLGDADLVALRGGDTPRLIEVKSTTRGAYHGFGPAKRDNLREAARSAGARAWLAWWPPRKPLKWYSEDVWPA